VTDTPTTDPIGDPSGPTLTDPATGDEWEVTFEDLDQPAPPAALPGVEADATWWAVRHTAAAPAPGRHGHAVIRSAQLLGELVTRLAETGATEIVIAAARPEDLAALQVARAFGTPSAPAVEPSDASPVVTDGRAAPGAPTAEEVAAMSVMELKGLLDRAMVTEKQACQELSRVAGTTLGLTDVSGHPERAVVLLAYCARARRADQPGRAA
jgi:hypothetical protein